MAHRLIVSWFVGGVALAALVAGCAAEKDHPPELKPHSVTDPKSCHAIQTASARNGDILLDGGVAACAAQGLQCVLPRSFDSGGKCAADERAFGSCSVNVWRVGCLPPDQDAATDAASTPEAAAIDANDDGQSGDAP